jgi:rhodanese-related sulfurtransferase
MKNYKIMVSVFLSLVLHSSVFAQNTQVKQEGISFETFEAKLKQASPNSQILDARTAEEYKLNHLKGAINVSVSDKVELQKQIDQLDKNKPVFVYSINNGRSGVLAAKLRD